MLKKMKDNVKECILNARIQIVRLLATIYIVLVSGSNAYAIQNSVYVTGTKKLLKDALAAAQGGAAGLVFVLWVVWELKKRVGEDNEEPQYSKKQKTAIIGLIIVETLATFFGVIGGYYGISFS